MTSAPPRHNPNNIYIPHTAIKITLLEDPCVRMGSDDISNTENKVAKVIKQLIAQIASSLRLSNLEKVKYLM